MTFQLSPTPYPSPGLLQAHFDASGGGFLESVSYGSLFTVTNNQIIIPASVGGAGITWVRGIWASTVTFRYDSYMADLAPSQTLPTAANYIAAANSDINNWNLGSGATFNTIASGGVISSATLGSGGLGYAVGNVVPINGGSNDAHVIVTAISGPYDPSTGTGGTITAFGSLFGGTSGYVSTIGATSRQAINTPTSTIITLASQIANGTSVQCSYSYRNGQLTVPGMALSGWPNLHSSQSGQDYGTANDGDNYVAGELYRGYKTFGDPNYQQLGLKILQAQFEAGAPSGQNISFDVPISAQQYSSGLYNYADAPGTLTWETSPVPDSSGDNGLNVVVYLPAGGPPYAAAGWGVWTAWPVTSITPLNSVSFDFWGDGTSNQIQLSTNIHNPSDSAGNFVYGFPCLPVDARIKKTFNLLPSDFWNTANFIYNGDRTSTYKAAYSSDGSAVLVNYIESGPSASGFNQWVSSELIISATSTYAGCYFGLNTGNVNSGAATELKLDLVSSIAQSITIKVIDSAVSPVTHSYVYTATQGSQEVVIPWGSFDSGTITHPITQVDVQPAANSCNVRVNNIRVATASSDVVTLGNSSYSLLNGFQFSFITNGNYNLWWKNFSINQSQINPYPNISRWTYDWFLFGNTYGYGSWRGSQAPAYQWMLGYALSGLTYPQNTIATYSDGSTIDYSGKTVVSCIRRFMKDAQDAYASQYPAQIKGPVMKKYGCWSWENVQGSGYIGGVAVPNVTYPNGVLNEWYCEGNDDWQGYQYRAFLSIAEDYFVSGDPVSLGVVQNWVNWVNSTFTFNSTTRIVTEPSTFNVNGTLANTSYLYGHICTLEAMLYKYWRDGDPICALWIPRLLDDLHYNFKITGTGTPIGVRQTAFGQGYSYCTASLIDPTGTGLTVTPYVAGGKITHTVISGSVTTPYTNPSIVYTGDGSGAAGNVYMNNALYGAYDYQHTGWEIGEYGKCLGLIVNGPEAIGTVFHQISLPSYVAQDYQDIWTFYTANLSDVGPGMLNTQFIPLHEFARESSWHWGTGIENPINDSPGSTSSRDTHTPGDSWTESIGPSLGFAIQRYQSDGNNVFLSAVENLVMQMANLVITQSQITKTTSNEIGLFAIGESQIGTIPPFNWTVTLISQYANSPILRQILQDFNDALDQTQNIDNFFDSIWNVETATGYGLDVWGRIVGVSRVLQVTQGKYFGFEEATTASADTFGQSAFYSGNNLTSNYSLSDDAFRLLIKAKAAANITNSSIPAINAILRNLFPNRGSCYVVDNQDMTMTYRFEFPLSPTEASIVTNSGVLPKPSGVSVSYSLV